MDKSAFFASPASAYLRTREMCNATRRRRPRKLVAGIACLDTTRLPRIFLGSNDTSVDDLFEMAEAFGIEIGNTEIDIGRENGGDDSKTSEQSLEILIGIEESSSDELRNLAKSLIELADELESDHLEESHSLRFSRVFSDVFMIRLRELASRAKALLEHRQLRDKLMSVDVFGEPAWDMLLELFYQFAMGKVISTKSLSLVSRVPATTALRYISELEKIGYLHRENSPADKRVSLASLTPKGVIEVGRVLARLMT